MLQTFILQFSGLEAGVTVLTGNKACGGCRWMRNSNAARGVAEYNIKNLQFDSRPILLQLARAFLCWKIPHNREVL